MSKRPTEADAYTLKRFREVPLFVVEDHNNVLPFIYRCIGSKHLPFNNNILIHFDSHPDLGIPLGLRGNVVFNKHDLFNALSIENWILPAAFAGHINRILWIKPPWAKQMANGSHKFKIGKDKFSDEIKVTSLDYYFLSDSLYSREENLEDVKDIELNIFTMCLPDNSCKSGKYDNIPDIVKCLNNEETYILDIDLDFFSTRNPFKALYNNANLYDELKKIYKFSLPDTTDLNLVDESLFKRKTKLQQLKSAWLYFGENGNLTGFTGDQVPIIQIEEIANKVKSLYNEVDWEMIHDAGCTCDDTGLPEHVSTKEEIMNMIEHRFLTFINQLPNVPTIVTISRSSEDDYCPPEDVDWIQNEVLTILKDKFNTNNAILQYENDSS